MNYQPAWTDQQDQIFDLTREYEDNMTAARAAWMKLTPEQRADPEVAGRYSAMKQNLSTTYRERKKAIQGPSILDPPDE